MQYRNIVEYLQGQLCMPREGIVYGAWHYVTTLRYLKIVSMPIFYIVGEISVAIGAIHSSSGPSRILIISLEV